jgi:beta-hydroxylase
VDGETRRRAEQGVRRDLRGSFGGQRVKKWNRKVYYALKYSLTAVILGLIVASALR